MTSARGPCAVLSSTCSENSCIYRGKRLVNWDTFLQTAVSDDEVFHDPVKGHFWHFRYPVIDPAAGEPDHVTIATTRPETMLGDTAVAVHPEPGRGARCQPKPNCVEKLAAAPAKDKEGLAAADRRRSSSDARRCCPCSSNCATWLGPVASCVCRCWIVRFPLIADPWAKPELGSGCVKITPAHDANDYEVGLRCQLPMINILHPDGTLNANAGPYQGLTIHRGAKTCGGRPRSSKGCWRDVEDREIDLAHSDRSKTPIEPYLADQWFVRMDELAQSAMDAVQDGRVQITPARYAKGYLDWLSEKRDWPVSRQLWWGHRIPIWSKSFSTRTAAEHDADQLQQRSACPGRPSRFSVRAGGR